MKLAAVVTGWLLLSTALVVQAAGNMPPSVVGFNANFVETRTLPGFNTPLVSHGKLRFDGDRGFRWEITAPYHYVFEMRGQHAQEQLPDGSIRQLDPEQTPWLAAVQHIFMSALAGERSELQRYFETRVTPLAKGQRITLTPKPGPMAKAIVSIQVTEISPGHPQKLEIQETSGGRVQIRFSPPTPAVSAP